ncbi:hypothetical protein JB92DRAFT_2831831 [Gautieria morchelliformis]|nr:hypothetical protein JB92DRAFT_2831831 [Gautieria morchelliformis]
MHAWSWGLGRRLRGQLFAPSSTEPPWLAGDDSEECVVISAWSWELRRPPLPCIVRFMCEAACVGAGADAVYAVHPPNADIKRHALPPCGHYLPWEGISYTLEQGKALRRRPSTPQINSHGWFGGMWEPAPWSPQVATIPPAHTSPNGSHAHGQRDEGDTRVRNGSVPVEHDTPIYVHIRPGDESCLGQA